MCFELWSRLLFLLATDRSFPLWYGPVKSKGVHILDLSITDVLLPPLLPHHRDTHTHARTHTNTHINFDLLWPWTSSASKYILFFLVAFIKHMHYKKGSSLVDISNFSKTKGLSGNQGLNKNSKLRQKTKDKVNSS